MDLCYTGIIKKTDTIIQEVSIMKRLYRTEGRDATVCGVCGGIAEFFGIDPTIVRVIAVLLFFPGGLSLWAYVIAALIIPKKITIYPGY